MPTPENLVKFEKYFDGPEFKDGYQIDPLIKPSVVTMCAFGLPTDYSCEGWNPKHPYWRPGRDRYDQGAADRPNLSFSNDPNRYDPKLLKLTFGDLLIPQIAIRLLEARKKMETLLKQFMETSDEATRTSLTVHEYHNLWFLIGKKIGDQEPELMHSTYIKDFEDFNTFLRKTFFTVEP